MPRGISKGAAVAWDLRRRGLGPADAVAIGDSVSDLEMAPAVGRLWITANGAAVEGMAPLLDAVPNVSITDAPLAAVGGAVFTTIVFAVLEQVNQLGSIRDYFPTAFDFAWTDLLQSPVDSGDLFRGVVQALVYIAVFTLLGFRHFARRDVTS